MKKTRLTAAALAVALACALPAQAMATAIPHPVPAAAASAGHANPGIVWGLGGCVGSIMLAAIVANSRDHRELTSDEAWTCGLAFWLAPLKRK